MRTIADDGTVNSIKATDFVNGVLPDAFIQAKINHIDPSKRWYITPKINTVTDVRADPVTFDKDGIPIFVAQGPRTFVGSFYEKDGSPTFAGVLNSFQCQDISFYEISLEGAIVGSDNDTEMLPTAIETGTFYSTVVKKNVTDPNSVQLTFAVNELVRDENIIQIGASAIETNMLTQKGLIDGTGVALAAPVITTTTVRIDLNYVYGDFPSKLPWKGVVSVDFSPDNGVTTDSVFNETASANLAINTVTEVADGIYDLVLAAGAASSNVISVDIFKAGFDMKAFTYLIP